MLCRLVTWQNLDRSWTPQRRWIPRVGIRFDLQHP